MRFGKPDWWFSDIVVSFCLVSVPIFVMVSGMLLLDEGKWDESPKSFFLKRFNRVVIPFVAWSILYSFWKLRFDVYHGHFLSPISAFIHDFPMGNVSPHLWFFYALIPVYAITPILRACMKKANKRHLMFFLILWFVAYAVYLQVYDLIIDRHVCSPWTCVLLL
jgi:surface polysaccharide O-acyltransferase-like enzyme